jgi:hypothetical protein
MLMTDIALVANMLLGYQKDVMDVDLTVHYIELQISNSSWTREGFHSFASLRDRRNSYPKSIFEHILMVDRAAWD